MNDSLDSSPVAALKVESVSPQVRPNPFAPILPIVGSIVLGGGLGYVVFYTDIYQRAASQPMLAVGFGAAALASTAAIIGPLVCREHDRENANTSAERSERHRPLHTICALVASVAHHRI